MKKIILLFILSIFLFSCDRSVDYNKKLTGDIVIDDSIIHDDYFNHNDKILTKINSDSTKKLIGYTLIGEVDYSRSLPDSLKSIKINKLNKFIPIDNKNTNIYDVSSEKMDLAIKKWVGKNYCNTGWEYCDRYSIQIDTVELNYSDTTIQYIPHETCELKSFDISNGFRTSYYTNEQKLKIEKENKDMDIMNTSILILLAIIFFILYSLIKNVNKKDIAEENRINNLKQLYQSTKNPILLIKTQMLTSQNQTRQIMTGALLYQTPKTYTLEIHCKNISDKIVTAVEFEIKTRNAFNEITSTFSKTSSEMMLFDKYIICKWELNNSIEIQNAITVVKRVKFSDGTIWNN
jgi:hypothetical protein